MILRPDWERWRNGADVGSVKHMDVVHWDHLCHHDHQGPHGYQDHQGHQGYHGLGSVKHTDVAFLMVMVNKDMKNMEIIILGKGHMDIINWKRLGSTFVLSWLKCEQIIERTKSTSTLWAAFGYFHTSVGGVVDIFEIVGKGSVLIWNEKRAPRSHRGLWRQYYISPTPLPSHKRTCPYLNVNCFEKV